MNIAIRVDSSLIIGSGHLMRCLRLADGLTDNGHKVCFFSRDLPGNKVQLLQSRGYQVDLLPLPDGYQAKADDYKSWLGVTQAEDALTFSMLVQYCDLVVVDHYALCKPWELDVVRRLGCQVVAIDDLAREHHAALVIDTTPNRSSDLYKVDHSHTKLLVGSDYALLAPEFVSLREKLNTQPVQDPEHRLLLFMGGGDVHGCTSLIVRALLKQNTELPITVLLGENTPSFKSVQALSQNYEKLTLITHSNTMAELIGAHTLAIGAPGVSALERLSLGIPSILVPVADNQTGNLDGLRDNEAIEVVTLDELHKLTVCLRRLMQNYMQKRLAAMSMCDGLGLFRVVDEIQRMPCNSKGQIQLRPATSADINLVFNWQQLPQTRRYALTPRAPSWEEHQQWMKRKLSSACDYMYIITTSFEEQEHSVGMVRLDNAGDNRVIISILIDPQYYGLGIGYAALNEVATRHSDKTIEATVKSENKASQKLFTKAGYIQREREIFILEAKNSYE